MGVSHVFQIVQVVPNRARHHIFLGFDIVTINMTQTLKSEEKDKRQVKRYSFNFAISIIV